MKGAKELADQCRDEAARQFGYFGAEERCSVLSDIAAHLDRLAAIDSAVPVEVGEIAYRHATAEGYLAQHGELARPYGNEAHRNRATLLAIVQRQAADTQAALNLARGHEQERDQQRARAEVAEQRADALAELVMEANPIGWASADKLDAADAWRKKAERLLNPVSR